MSFKYVDRIIIKGGSGLAALKTLMVANMEQRFLFLLFNDLVLLVIDCALGI